MGRSRRGVLSALAAAGGTRALGVGSAGGVGSVLAACGGAGREPAISLAIETPVTVTLLLNGTPSPAGADPQQKSYQTVFRAAQPKITIDFQGSGGSGSDHVTKLIALTVAGTPPDVFYAVQGSDMPSLVAKNVLRPLDDLIKADPKFKKEDWFEVHLGAWQHQGKQRGLPWQGGPLITYYNRELLAEAGVGDLNEATWTYDAWRDTGAKLRRTMAGGDVARWATDVGGQWLHWLYAFGGDVLDKTWEKGVLGSKEALARPQ